MLDIAIVGAGSVGLLLAAYLSEKHTVTLYTKTAEQATLINQKGVTNLTIKKTVFPRAEIIDRLIPHEYIIVAVKSYHIQSLMPTLANVSTCFIFIQNGMSHVKEVEFGLKQSSNWFGIVTHGAKKYAPTAVAHTGVGEIKLAPSTNNLPTEAGIKRLKSLFRPLNIHIEHDCKAMLHKKLLVNAVINPLTAHYNIKNGQLLSAVYEDEVRDLCKRVSKLLDLDYDEAYRDLITIITKTKENESSMLQDIKNQRRTEIDAILGYLLTLENDYRMRFHYEFIKKREEALM
ncbi:2-dehydropantoate 2-reductase [Halolactibacillus alkaliphilus]|uniref:2-dehydropantoate 2-reductase n=1 Tax=Halolactibacillus alkaliphilus TaxID=442899 RepID=A0A511WX32_9BACI|nr:2-dehydropantoate 2-reductase [Halolactibacillus alkaliphilus]GEN55685.1 2-dehydropantoate 2-reductase [Halolactibacillus alkaliphilus]GGN65399.1 2-dehydropantoate 2-reductase [Halolactibacillus alkaliphilus]SFO63808.1 2-dehydropantoate 2-reductase [Halolactibacillus alkaliphilus]